MLCISFGLYTVLTCVTMHTQVPGQRWCSTPRPLQAAVSLRLPTFFMGASALLSTAAFSPSGARTTPASPSRPPPRSPARRFSRCPPTLEEIPIQLSAEWAKRPAVQTPAVAVVVARRLPPIRRWRLPRRPRSNQDDAVAQLLARQQEMIRQQQDVPSTRDGGAALADAFFRQCGQVFA